MPCFLQVSLVAAAILGLLYSFWPKGNPLYEGLHLLPWLLRMRSLERPGPRPPRQRYGSHRRQYLQHYLPAPGSSARHHAILYIHGSGWMFGSPEMFRAEAQALAALGYHVFMVSHRRTPQFHIGHLRHDFVEALSLAQHKLDGLGLASQKIILVGNSAGGNLCALAVYDRSLLAGAGLSRERIGALALLAAPLDLRQMWPSPPLMLVTRFRNEKIMRDADPACHVCGPEALPTLVVHGDRDGIVEYGSSVAFVSKMRALGASNLRFVTLPGGTHLDSASWCFPGHVCNEVFFEWLESVDSQ